MRAAATALLLVLCAVPGASSTHITWAEWKLTASESLCGLATSYEISSRADRQSQGAFAGTPYHALHLGFYTLVRKSVVPEFAGLEPGEDIFVVVASYRSPRASGEKVAGVFVAGTPILPMHEDKSSEFFALYSDSVAPLVRRFRNDMEIPIEIRLVDGRVIQTSVLPSSRGTFDDWHESYRACNKDIRKP